MISSVNVKDIARYMRLLQAPRSKLDWGNLADIYYRAKKYLKLPYVSRLLPLHQWIKSNCKLRA